VVGHWRMESWLMRELLPQVWAQAPVRPDRTGITGHSMGGHGALTLALRHPGVFQRLGAGAHLRAHAVPLGRQGLRRLPGRRPGTWAAHDASALMRRADRVPYPQGILVDQGLADKFLAEQLHPQALEAACAAAGQPLTLRRHAGYDHGYYFIASVIDDHLRHHAATLVG
jgi:S-formylglutathione hydrolase